MSLTQIIKDSFKLSQETVLDTLNDPIFLQSLEDASARLIETFNTGGKVLLAGNGGSAADSQHICAEFIGRLNFDRKTLPAIALTVNTSNLTCIGNDYGYDEIFCRQFEALANENDTLIVYTTSGNSKNILKLLDTAIGKVKSIIALTGSNIDNLKEKSDVIISVNSSKTTKIQEIHAIAGHVMCECVEETLFSNET